jgi:hypothetical protein
MPRIRRDESETVTLKLEDVEEDYLDVDKPLPGQNYYCVSFVSPDKILAQKEQFMFYHYERSVQQRLTILLDEALTNLINKSEDGNVDVAEIIRIKKAVAASCKEEEVTFDKFKEKIEDFKFRDEEKIGEEFDKANSFRTSVRGVKVRGTFDTKREADIRAAVLQRQDQLFDVFVGQVGYWCPWDPNPQKIDDIEYMNTDLNKLVKEYKNNEAKKDVFYQEQKSQRQKDSISTEERIKHQEGLKSMNDFRDSIQQSKTADALNTPLPSSTGLISLNSTGTNLESLLNITGDNVCGTTTETTSDDTPNAITQSIEIGGENSKEVTLEQTEAQLTSDDPWLQRKMAEKATDTSIADAGANI